jgi:iron(III) transport system ATP-binding protein
MSVNGDVESMHAPKGVDSGPTGADHAAVVTGLRKSFISRKTEHHAVRGVDLRVARGEYVVILGPSGCGKSTLIRCIAGLEKPTGGRIELAGETVFDADARVNVQPERRKLGMVFQDYALWPHMDIAKNVAYPLRMQRVPKNQRAERVAEVLRVLECATLADRLPAELSGGQQQRIALARALVSRPGLLLLDEPLSNLDALLRVSLRAELLRLHRTLGFTALHITHDQDEALEMGDRIVLMRDGEVEQVGPPEEVYMRPVSPYAATFFGVRNNLSCRVRKGRLEHDGGVVTGSEIVASGRPEGQAIQLFVRSRDTRIRGSADELAIPQGTLTIEGTLAQVVLGEGGHRQAIVDVRGQQWFVDELSHSDTRLGDTVEILMSGPQVLLYCGEKLEESDTHG